MPPDPLLGFDDYLTAWSRGHGGYDPAGNRLVLAWLRVTYACASPLARRRVAPNAVTALGLAACALVPALALGARAPGFGVIALLLAAAMVVLSGLLDGLDGAVAVLTDRLTRFGAVLDGLADRLGEVCYLVALWLLGAPGWLCVLGCGVALLHEYVRAAARAVGVADIGVVTVSERPTRLAVTAVTLGLAAVVTADRGVATGGALVWAVLGLVGGAQLLIVVRRRLV